MRQIFCSRFRSQSHTESLWLTIRLSDYYSKASAFPYVPRVPSHSHMLCFSVADAQFFCPYFLVIVFSGGQASKPTNQLIERQLNWYWIELNSMFIFPFPICWWIIHIFHLSISYWSFIFRPKHTCDKIELNKMNVNVWTRQNKSTKNGERKMKTFLEMNAEPECAVLFWWFYGLVPSKTD